MTARTDLLAAPVPAVTRWWSRAVAAVPLVVLVLVVPAHGGTMAGDATKAAIFAMVGLGMNVLVGYTGQISLGHQAFLGIGALTAANVVHSGTNAADLGSFAVGMVAATVVAGTAALLLGAVALRIRGLYLALVTLVFGSVVADAVFTLSSLNGRDAGVPAYRPQALAGDYRYYLFAVAALALCIYVDVWLVRTKGGRALVAVRDNELVAQAYGVPVTSYKLLGFTVSGAMAGLAGGVFAFWNQAFSDKDFTAIAGFNLALIFVVMVVVGGLGTRTGVIVASVFFALVDPLLSTVAGHTGWSGFYTDHKYYISSLIGGGLLLLTVVQHPGGLGDQLKPVTRWFAGRPFVLRDPDDDGGVAAMEGSSVRA